MRGQRRSHDDDPVEIGFHRQRVQNGGVLGRRGGQVVDDDVRADGCVRREDAGESRVVGRIAGKGRGDGDPPSGCDLCAPIPHLDRDRDDRPTGDLVDTVRVVDREGHR